MYISQGTTKLTLNDVVLVRDEERMIARFAREIERAIKASFVAGHCEGLKDAVK